MKKLFLFLLSFIPILSFAQGVYQSTGDLKQTGNYPIIWGKNVKGAPQGKATKVQMLAIPASFRDTSMTCYVIETDSTYRLQQDLVTWMAVAPGNVALALKTINKSLLAKIDTSALGAPRGIATLDPGGKVPVSQLPASLFIYKGMYNAATNTPALTDASGTEGYVYQVNVAGTHNFGSGNITLNVGDYVIHNGTIWQKSAGTGYVTSVNNKQGTINLTTDDVPEGSNQYYTNGRAIGSKLTGYSSSSGSVSSSDNILSAIGKLNGNIGALSSVYIQNQNTGSQSANFNISGSGMANNLILSGTDGSGNLSLPMQISKPSAPASGVKIYSQNGLSWVNSNGFSKTLNWPSTTGDHIATFIDANGTVPFLESEQTWSGVNTFGANPIIKNTNPTLTLTETATNYSTILSKSPTLNNLSLTHQLYQAGGQGSAIVFNPTVAQYGRSTDVGLPSGNSLFSVSFFINNNSFSTGSGQSIVAWGNASTCLSIRYFSNPKVVVYNGAMVLASFPMPSNIGYHQVLITYNGSTISGYVDNVLIGNAAANINTVLGGGNSFFIGNAINTANPFNGELDEIVIWNKVLTRTSGTGVTADEVSANWFSGYGTPAPPSISNIIRRYSFDEGSGSVAIDQGSNAVNLSLINTPLYDLNGKVAKSGNIQNGVALSFSDGINNSERGQWVFGDTQGGTILEGRAIRHLINGYFPFLQGLDGHIVLDPSTTISSPDINGSYNASSILKIGAGNASVAPLQFASGVYNTTPLPGSLEYNGAFSFGDATNSRYSFVGLEKNQTFTGFNTFAGAISAISGTGRGLYLNPNLLYTNNGDNVYALDIAGSAQGAPGGSAIGSATITNGGSGYVNGIYSNVSLINGSGVNALAASVTVSGGSVTAVQLNINNTNITGYAINDVLSANANSLGGSGSGFTYTVNSLRYNGGSMYSIRVANAIIPAAANNQTLGTVGLPFAYSYSNTARISNIQVLSGNLTFLNQGGGTLGMIGNSTGNFIWGNTTPTDAGYKIDINNNATSSNGLLRLTGAISDNNQSLLTGLLVNPILTFNTVNQKLIGADFSPTFLGGASSIINGIVSSSNYATSGTSTGDGSSGVSFVNSTGIGIGATVIVTISGGVVTTVNITRGGSGYAIGNVLTATYNGLTVALTLSSGTSAGGVGLTGIGSYAARFGDKITITPHPVLATPLVNTLEVDNSGLYWSNNLAVRNQLAYLNSPSFSGTPTAPTASPGTNTNQIATTAFVLANTIPGITSISGSQGVSVSGGSTPTIGLGDITPTTIKTGSITGASFSSVNSAFNIYASWQLVGLAKDGVTNSELTYGHLLTDTISLKSGYLNTNITRIVQNPSFVSPNILTLPSASGTFALTGDKVGQFYNDAGYITSSALSGYATTDYVSQNYKPIGYTPDLSAYATTDYVSQNYKPIGYTPSWAEFKNKLLDNVGETVPAISNSDAGSQLYIATNYAGGGYGEVDYFSIPGKSPSGRGHHAFYTLNPNQGASGGIKLDFGSFGDNNAFTTGGPIAPGIVDHTPNVTQRVPVFDTNTNTIYYRTPTEFASDLGYALGTGYAVLNGNNSYSGDQSINGSIVATGNITTTSDQRLKKNIVDLASATQKLKNIRAVSFDRIDIDKHQIGLLAQNVRTYYPELVEEDKNKMLSVNYGMFIAPLLKGWQEQQKRIEALERKVKRLTKKK